MEKSCNPHGSDQPHRRSGVFPRRGGGREGGAETGGGNLGGEVLEEAVLADAVLEAELLPELHPDLVPALPHLYRDDLPRHLSPRLRRRSLGFG